MTLIFNGCSRAVEESAKEATKTSSRDIISLSPSITETIYAFGGASRLMGVDRFSEQVPEAKEDLESEEIRLFGDAFSPKAEAIKVARPKIIFVEGDSRSKALMKLGDAVHSIKSENLLQILNMWQEVGRKLDATKLADDAVEKFQSQLKALEFESAPRVLMTYSSPRQGTLFCVGIDSYQSEILESLGAKNALREGALATVTPQLSLEDVRALDPDLIISILASDAKDSAQERWKSASTLKAFRHQGLIDLAGSEMTFYGPRSLPLFAKRLRQALIDWRDR